MAKRVWDKTLFAKYEHVASPSQLVDYLDCPRKWWFRRCLQIPEKKDQKKFIFGNCVDAIANLWLSADDSGRDKAGNPVDLYPPGWNAGLTPTESALARLLFEKAVAEGVIRRVPNRKIQFEYTSEVLPGICTTAAMDMVSPEGVEDQKTTKSTDWISTQKALAADPKMLSYAYEWLKTYREAKSVKLRLNYLVKNPEAPSVKPVEAIVPVASVLEFWEKTAVPAHAGMLQLKRARIPEQKWREVTGPQTKDTCKKYGGCPYARICGGCSSPAALKAEIGRINLKLEPKPARKMTPNIFAKKPAVPLAPAPVAPPPAPPAPPPAPSAANPTTNAPWAFEGCGACKGKGINKQGNPCKACHTIRKRRGEPTVDDFDTWHDQQGNLCWKAKDGSTPAPAPAPQAQVAPPAVAQAPVAPPIEGKAAIVAEVKPKKPKPVKVIEPEIKEAPSPQVEQAPQSDLAAGGFRLFINAMPVNAAFVDMADILAREGAQMATEFEVKSFYDLDAFKRRDMLAGAAADIAAELTGRDVVAVGGGQDLKALVEALRPFADQIVQGVF